MMRCLDVEKVLLGTFSWSEKSKFGWEAKERVYWSCTQAITWESFKTNMKKQYIPKATRDKKAAEFDDLVQ